MVSALAHVISSSSSGVGVGVGGSEPAVIQPELNSAMAGTESGSMGRDLSQPSEEQALHRTRTPFSRMMPLLLLCASSSPFSSGAIRASPTNPLVTTLLAGRCSMISSSCGPLPVAPPTPSSGHALLFLSVTPLSFSTAQHPTVEMRWSSIWRGTVRRCGGVLSREIWVRCEDSSDGYRWRHRRKKEEMEMEGRRRKKIF
uniref:Uncharacterized protein LOC109504802 n=1 Tax=Elaeis guineensis var. tenera TaxID=51953 RepID=A0A8N4EPJ7_ELAGV|nr:uncharacterized protein LOC109504802 [Elaeis guineensis]